MIKLDTLSADLKHVDIEYLDIVNYEIARENICGYIFLLSRLSKVTEQNERNNVSKDENGYYIDNGTNSIKIDLKMITIEKTYPMELIYKNNITNFVKNFNVILFKCTNIEYHKTTGKVSKLIFEQVEK